LDGCEGLFGECIHLPVSISQSKSLRKMRKKKTGCYSFSLFRQNY
jgi:hypothetical protein